MTLSIQGLTKAYGGLRVVDEVRFEVPSGALVGVIGPNGAGKSTLFSLITGFLAADGGNVAFEGRALGRASPMERARAGMVRTFQVPREFSHLTVRENLMAAYPKQSGERLIDTFFRPGRVKAEEAAIAREVEETIAFLRLQKVADVPAGRLSGGQKKLVELGRALMTGARMILLDEPFAGVNPVLIEELSVRIRELNARGIGFLIIEHDLPALNKLVSTLHVMDRGQLIASGTPAEVLANPRVRDAYLGGAAA
ncbi:amino acid/amide ABC transporter ATP-binding protein 1 (HAAT family) [Azorhizobium sp. AG788]|uniref:ABC transporter ATP-binding protein n=1 Tax=Azorhizobium sp. AG788 TaxID=2183897 RepID=UPI001061438D|nr:ABC transporter ATP-binding protein [Azorhizobium sp. AG788]TDT93455.1 amino acid/amide ABC transporter ATP-binding protein 1 (HAAT family) [Azorhizobium sp. AG788]